MNKLLTQGSNQNRPFKPKFIKEEIIIMTEVGNRKGLDWIVVIDIEDQIIEIALSMDKTMQKGLNTVRIIEEEIIGKQTIEENKIIEENLLEGKIEVTM